MPNVDKVEIEVTTAHRDCESEKDNLGSTLFKEEVLESARKFGESLRLHDGDKVDEEIQSILNDMDLMDPITMDGSVMAE